MRNPNRKDASNGHNTVAKDQIREDRGALEAALKDAGAIIRGKNVRCPFHDDRSASGSIYQADDGTWRFKCHAECGFSGDIFDVRERVSGQSVADQLKALNTDRHFKRSSGKAYQTKESAVEAVRRMILSGSKLVQIHGVTVDDFSDNFSEVRCDGLKPDGEASKDIRPIYRDGAQWRVGDPSGLLPLYQLQLPASGPIVVVEGPKCVRRARTLGFAATTSSHGAQSPEKTDWTPVAEYGEVVILPDADTAGKEYAQKVAKIVMELNPRANVKIVELPGLTEGDDIVEFCGGCEDDANIRQQILDRIESTSPWERVDEAGPVLTDIADVKRVEVKWLWPNHIPLGRLTLLAGKPGEGKTYVTTDLAARLSRQFPWPDGQKNDHIGSTLMIVAEDAPDDTIAPRLDAAGVDQGRGKVKLLTVVRRLASDGKLVEQMFTLDQIPALESALRKMPDCKLVVIDPIGSFIGGRVDSHRDNEVRAVLAPLAAVADRFGVAVLLVAHTRKAFSPAADDTVLGSRAFTGLARAVWHLSHDATDRDRKLLLPGKCNLSKQPSGLAFKIDDNKLVWESNLLQMHADDVLTEDDKPGPQPEARRAAEAWLQEVLAGGGVPSGDKINPEPGTIRYQAEEADLAWRTVRRASESLGVIRGRDPYTKKYTWRLPKNGANLVVQPGCPPLSQQEQLGQPGQPDQSLGYTEWNCDDNVQVVQPDSAGQPEAEVKLAA